MLQDLASKIGQLFLVGFAGDRLGPDHPLRTDIVEGNLGGVILFDRFVAGRSDRHNIVDAAQIRELTATLQDLANGRLLIAVDQEGGRVSRFPARRGFPETPPAAALGAAGVAATALAARQTAEMLSQAGVNFNLAPVVDLDLNPDNPIIGRYGRSFAKAAATVASHAEAWIDEIGRASCRERV